MNPPPMAAPAFIPWAYPAQNSTRGDEAPARIRTAVEVLAHLTSKTAKRLAASELAIQEFEGNPLTPEEQILQTEACKVLGNYLDGSLRPNVWETDAMQSDGVNYLHLKCFACSQAGESSPECPMCEGCGSILVRPMIPKNARG